MAEATFFAEKLHEADIDVKALIVNRMHPHFSDTSADVLRARAARFADTELGTLTTNLADFVSVSSREESHVAGLADRVAPAPVIRVPFLATDVHDLDGLGAIGWYLFPR